MATIVHFRGVTEFECGPYLVRQNAIVQTVPQPQQQQMENNKQSPASQQSQQTPTPSVLRVIVENMCYQITVDTLKQVTSAHIVTIR